MSASEIDAMMPFQVGPLILLLVHMSTRKHVYGVKVQSHRKATDLSIHTHLDRPKSKTIAADEV